LLPVCIPLVIVSGLALYCVLMYIMHEACMQLEGTNKLHSVLVAKANWCATDLLPSRLWNWMQASKWCYECYQNESTAMQTCGNSTTPDWSSTSEDGSRRRRLPSFFCFNSPPPST